MMVAENEASRGAADGRRFCAAVRERLPNGMYRLQRADGTELLAHVAGDMRMQFTRLLPGDVVEVETSPFDRGKARIAGLQQPGRSPATGRSNQRTNPTSESKP